MVSRLTEMLMIRPSPASSNHPGRAVRTIRNGPFTFVSQLTATSPTRSPEPCWLGHKRIAPNFIPRPVLLTRISRRPNRFAAASRTISQSLAFVTSATRGTTVARALLCSASASRRLLRPRSARARQAQSHELRLALVRAPWVVRSPVHPQLRSLHAFRAVSTPLPFPGLHDLA